MLSNFDLSLLKLMVNTRSAVQSNHERIVTGDIIIEIIMIVLNKIGQHL